LGTDGALDEDCRLSINYRLWCSDRGELQVLGKMAKSLRSRSLRKTRSLLSAQVFKPVDDARTARLSHKLTGGKPIPEATFAKAQKSLDVEMSGSVSTYDFKSSKQSIVSQITRKSKKFTKRGSKSASEKLNGFGYSMKEIRF